MLLSISYRFRRRTKLVPNKKVTEDIGRYESCLASFPGSSHARTKNRMFTHTHSIFEASLSFCSIPTEDCKAYGKVVIPSPQHDPEAEYEMVDNDPYENVK